VNSAIACTPIRRQRSADLSADLATGQAGGVRLVERDDAGLRRSDRPQLGDPFGS